MNDPWTATAAALAAKASASRQGMARLAETVHRAADAAWAAARAEAPAAACAAGCDWCCRHKVAVSFPEAVLVAEHVRALPDAKAKPLIARLVEADEAGRGLSVEQRRRQAWPCPFLDAAGGCSIYPARPLACRSVHSRDRDFCRVCAEDPQGSRAAFAAGTLKPALLSLPERLFGGYLRGLAGALAKAGFDARMLELNAAVRAILDDRRLVLAWVKKGRLPEGLT